ncbi:MAG: class I SAM-dependent methyltransferase [Aquamicrobium sp.]|uniref:class I SAM-dependent methyltransferase n=1 Tax=Aquamicrobium sp. TaxID=1872579 RepID=UPI00349EAE77|nr:class I SAM-dependent methyltransferase [Aquamicrobium sp.]
MDDFTKTLFHPFEAGLIDMPGKDARVLFLNAAPGFRRPDGFAAEIAAVQAFRPAFLALRKAGVAVEPEAPGEGYDLALVLAGRHRGQNELWVAEALERVRPGGRVVVAGGKTDGAASLAKRLAGLGEVEGRASKHHGVVFWLRRGDHAAGIIAALNAANPALALEGGFRTLPGLFSHERADAGSRFLLESLPAGLKGVAADFGAGWGYLAASLALRAPDVTAIDLFEASFTACEAAKANMAALAPQVAARVFWHDLLAEPVERHYDLVVMNPPFHQGRAAEPAIGEGMIRAASKALKPGGRLYLVANRPLPYEAVLQQTFARHGETARNERFKVLWAVR